MLGKATYVGDCGWKTIIFFTLSYTYLNEIHSLTINSITPNQLKNGILNTKQMKDLYKQIGSRYIEKWKKKRKTINHLKSKTKSFKFAILDLCMYILPLGLDLLPLESLKPAWILKTHRGHRVQWIATHQMHIYNWEYSCLVNLEFWACAMQTFDSKKYYLIA